MLNSRIEVMCKDRLYNNILVKGVSGSGKSTYLINRVNEYINKYSVEDGDSILVLFKNKLSKAIGLKLYEEQEREETLFSFLDIKVDFYTYDELVENLLKIKNINLCTDDKKRELLLESIDIIKKDIKNSKIFRMSNIENIEKEICEIISSNISKEQYIEGRRKVSYVKAKKNSHNRELLYNVSEIFKNLILKNNVYIKDVIDIEIIEKFLDNNDIYTHIAIDDGDFLTEKQRKFIYTLRKDSSISTVTITSKKNIKDISFEKTYNLRNNIRSSEEINNLIKSFKGNKNISEENINRPHHLIYDDMGKSFLAIRDLIKNNISLKYKYEDIIVLFKNEEELKKGKLYFVNSKIPCRRIKNSLYSNGDKIKLAVFDDVLGISSKVVIVTNFNNENYSTIKEKKILIDEISMAENELYLVGYGRESKFVNKLPIGVLEDRRFVSNKGIESFTYVDCKKNKVINLLRDISAPKNMLINVNGKEEELADSEVSKVKVFSHIAAGMPIFISEEETGEMYLPKSVLTKNKEHFILTIDGDSMVNVGINNGDKVVIERNNTVENGDICAVEIDGNATLKTVKIESGMATLISENDNYAPMNFGLNEIRIIGQAVGIIKNN